MTAFWSEFIKGDGVNPNDAIDGLGMVYNLDAPYTNNAEGRLASWLASC